MTPRFREYIPPTLTRDGFWLEAEEVESIPDPSTSSRGDIIYVAEHDTNYILREGMWVVLPYEASRDFFTEKVSKLRRPVSLVGRTAKMEIPHGDLYVTLNWKESEPFETFVKIGNAGEEIQAYTEAIGRLISLHLRTGGDLTDAARQIRGISAETSSGVGPNRFLSTPDAIGQLLEDLINAGEPEK